MYSAVRCQHRAPDVGFQRVAAQSDAQSRRIRSLDHRLHAIESELGSDALGQKTCQMWSGRWEQNPPTPTN
ncbi:hypothetical protein XAC3810_620012 [Xanthomonas citri pv. citri]|uniref:Uncharacterized protein n=1 Tax=Xanthomonas citri pv. citri TaxID=611301 RepID=A0A0U4YPY3_XANCI|nr:hypothetical protein XAC3824_790012 [Xanthomonas citri pv. citri]CEE34769.1 hypothetical protein XAC9322_600012 [Xanthomonas citri pv. citri]CEE35825.1 hypothetical protein XAC1083_620012 [Xanthomonas citri pv. citri]CEE45113.1 hypothetical protein XAC3810_620012 [Xanthomonas citri pv. citri]CEE46114.1 hypothetical protein XAC902_870007 [Xanthomonas citri pv. citri]